RPFGLHVDTRGVWASFTCTGPSTSDLRAYVYRYDPVAGTWGTKPAYEASLDGYDRGVAYSGNGISADWHAWNETLTAVNAQPIVTDIAFDSNDDMTLGLNDRNGDKMGTLAGNLDTTSSTTYEAFSAGDILRACANASDTAWAQESNGSCGSRTGNGVGNGNGPGSGEFYYDDYTTTHNQTALGSVDQVPGFPQIVTSTFDPSTDVRVDGFSKLNNSDGSKANGTDVTADGRTTTALGAGTFSKAGGVGDIEALLSPAPIEIGNRVWHDDNKDGIQEPGEAPIAGVTVDLYQGSTLVGTDVTDAAGEYYFNDANVTGNLLTDTAYKIELDNASDAAAGGPLHGLALTSTTTGPDPAVDSDGVGAGNGPRIAFTTGGPGANDHTLDFGFITPSVSVGDYVWADTNKDGIQEGGEPGLPNVKVTVTGPGGGSVTDTDGNPVGPATTDGNGAYTFVKLPALPAGQHYTVTVDPTSSGLAGYVPTTANVGNDTSIDSSTGSATSGDLTTDGDRDSTLDFGYFKASVSVGDYVWADTNKNGIQNGGEPGIQGVKVTLTGPGGGSVTDVNGNPVNPTTTDVNGGYTFTGLPPLPAGQHYTTTVDGSSASLTGYTPTAAGAGGDTSKDSSTGSAASGDLTANGDRDSTLDFGFFKSTVSVGDFVWVDANKDGIQQGGEPGIQGVTLKLTGPGG
ncbi:MAG TPA: SdrD B-like domain-containing protein, partial [Acidimicrobiales bacterium]